mgnify:CR=1 FL=1
MTNDIIMPSKRPGHRRGAPAVKPKNMKGTLRRLWELTDGHRQGLGWIFLLSGLSAGSAVVAPYIIGKIVNLIDKKQPFLILLAILASFYIGEWLIHFLQHYLMAYPHESVCAYEKASAVVF